MIEVLALRQSYERREISEVRWMEGTNNPADDITKNTPNKALEELVSTNKLSMKVEGYVVRGKERGKERGNE